MNNETTYSADETIHPSVRVGHVHLRGADLDRAIGFYRDVLGFGVTADAREAGIDTVLLAADDYYHHHHHHIALNTWDSAGATPPPPGHTGPYHVASLYPNRRELGHVVRRLVDDGYPIDDATDHGGTVSVYLSDPHGNGIELYYDRPRDVRFDPNGRLILKNERFDYHEPPPRPHAGRTLSGTCAQLVQGSTTRCRRAAGVAANASRVRIEGVLRGC
jgi:catechol 2,3-dioxygenase